MSKGFWHTKKEKPTEDKTIFAQHKSVIRDSGVDWFIWEPQEFTDAIREDVIAWCYLDDLLALETELERTRKALDIATGFIKGISQTVINDCDNQYVVLGNFKKFAQDTLNQIKTALEQKDVK